ncbi:hypothetical protein DNAM5_143 [Haloarcula californiae tailed virus 1]|uniref:Uncharacterized protein n=1 Tax=Haloarcula californiae tailed virus 1 TaxID=1273746 RepID=R4TAM8_9CAUD|nr:hypothetical protein M202_gp078 [Haloarcula californiae tailed virus 1]AGM12000.1 hypothetical protein DNAM5_143 [Haloarcula californiae tailed virus 1]
MSESRYERVPVYEDFYRHVLQRLFLFLACRPVVRRFLTNIRHWTRRDVQTSERPVSRVYEGGGKWVRYDGDLVDAEEER